MLSGEGRSKEPELLGEAGAPHPSRPPLTKLGHPTPASLLLGRGQSPVSPETSCFSTLHEWYGREIMELRRAWLQRAQENQPECKDQDRP